MLKPNAMFHEELRTGSGRAPTSTATGYATVENVACSDSEVTPGTTVLMWDLADPKDQPLEAVRATREEIERRVGGLLNELK